MSGTTEQIINSFDKSKHTEKLFFGKYLYKVVFSVADKVVIDTPPARRTSSFNGYGATLLRRTRYRQHATDLIISIKECITNEHRSRVEGKTATLYTSSAEDVVALINNYSTKIVEINCPVNDNHASVISSNRKIRVRKNLFDNNFKFKVTFKPYWNERENRFPSIKEWVDTMDNEGARYGLNTSLKNFFNTNYNQRLLGWTIAVYLNDEQDLFVCRLKLHNMISFVEEAVLISEL